MSKDLNERSIIVTGGGRGIGEAIAQGLAAEGAMVMVADIDGESAQNVAAAIRADGGTAIPAAVDVTRRDSVEAMIGDAVEEHGRLDVIFNNAGIAQTKPFLSITESDWQEVMDVNGLGVLLCMQEAIKQMLDQGDGGKVINTASIAGKQGYDPLAHYCASKFGVVALTQAAARAFGADGINVNAICPGVVNTEMWRVIDRGFLDEGLTERENQAFETFSEGILLGRPSVAQDLVGVACFLASSDSDYMTGQTLIVDGGMVLQ
ncbi:MAG: glucose 1-dehydrogenase [Kiloniellales bacterium]